ncbi:MAG: HEAT repeat domain-containing protein [Deferribacteraceae bacterium]|jgi:HEAT repeat protein/anti-anti-sigma regulatory factor|nr:HEAT repeat domain-containing protein [Deferribacteraceae bacterium]
MSVTFSAVNDSVLIHISQEASDKDFGAVLESFNNIPSLKEVRIDMKDLVYIESEIQEQIVSIKKNVGAKSVHVVLLNVSESVYTTLEMADLLNLFIFKQDLSLYHIDELVYMFHNPDVANEISVYISSNYSPDFHNKMMEGANSEDSQVREHCILTMGRAQDSDATEVIRQGMDSVYPNVVRASILALGWLGDCESKERFFNFISSKDIEVAEAAGASISLVSDERDPEKLRKLSESENSNIRIIVAGTLSLINGDEAYAIIVKMLEKERNEQVRTVLVQRIAYFNKPDATEMLISMLDDSSKSVKEAAAAGLGRTGLRGHEDEVLKRINMEDVWLSYFAVKALGQNCSAKSAKYLKEIYNKSEEHLRLAIIEALSNAPSDMDNFFAERLFDSNEDIRKVTLSAIYKSNKKTAIAKSVKLLEDDPSWLVRYKALEIISIEKPAGYKKVLTKIKKKDNNRNIQEKIASVLGI